MGIDGRGLALVGTGVVAASLLTAAPAGAASYAGGPWSNNGCQYQGLAWDAGSGQSTPGGEVWESNGEQDCSGGWVELHYTDSKGNNQVSQSTLAWNNTNGYATALAGPSGSTFRYACISARSKSVGNWSVVRKLGTGSGSCGAP